jgi:AbrB family transcriptional regulator, transcriptional pleiotropic regulator of transition state genes
MEGRRRMGEVVMIKATGIVRKVDDLGRMVIPKELRDVFNIDVGSPLEIWLDGEDIILRPYVPGCMFCDEKKELLEFKSRKICQGCLDEMIECAMEFYK